MRPSFFIQFVFAASLAFPDNANRPTWVEDVNGDLSSVILPHYDLYEYEDTGNWSDPVTRPSGNHTGELRWIRELSNMTKEEGEGMKMRCEVEGDPKPVTVRWLRNEAPIEAGLGFVDRKRLSIRTSQTEGRVNSRLRIARLETHDSGFYTCQAKNALGLTSRTTGVLMVRMAPWGHDVGRSRQSTFPLHPQQIDSEGIRKEMSVGLSSSEIRLPDIDKNRCEEYKGKLCASVLANKTVYIPASHTQEELERKLELAFGVVKNSEDLSKTCEPFAVPTLCYVAFSICQDSVTQVPKQICRKDCEFLENELCVKEYAIAKRHPVIGELQLPVCVELPMGKSPEDCISLGLPKPEPVDPGDYCYWGQGESYRGAIGYGESGNPCIHWAENFQLSIAEHRELLGGHSHCRNPGSLHPQPWCFTSHKNKTMVEMCKIPKCINTFRLYLTAVGLGFLVLVVTLFIFCCCRSRLRKRNELGQDGIKSGVRSPCRKAKGSGLEMSALIPGSGASSIKSDARVRVREFHPANIRFVQELGEGAFGKVYKGEIIGTGEQPLMVAIKTLKENASAKTMADFKREVDLMCELRHENIVCLIGVCLSREPLSMLFEFMPKGDLHEFLIAHSPHSSDNHLSQADLLTMAIHIAAGMEYLCSHHYVHRDLAARNCLVAENLTVKISDFGLSRDVYSSDYYRYLIIAIFKSKRILTEFNIFYRVQSKSLLPVRWMPPESILYGKFTTESDVWSYGVVLWEIYSFGLQPYYGYSNQEVIEMIRSRQLLPCPEDCPSRMYSVMMECWHEVAVRRPHFPEICARLRSFQSSQAIRMPTVYSPSPAHI
ncbi:tyrosine-protein kinase transmembrane receptor Ror-like isoform X2 [Cimex lectularius]|uniref:Tyrosine-protein kinase receptor n=1 Tax=Cimex lectularius TaxID=79782 RepID=A0A8I6SD55_CIMLE|nr:tyrosine-protein kinase transmembrane receptor Ror-like isoform X2 [Cimex lectularius]